MFTVAAETLAQEVLPDDLAAGVLFPRLPELRQVTAEIAQAVAKEAAAAGVAAAMDDEVLAEKVTTAMWDPEYPQLQAV